MDRILTLQEAARHLKVAAVTLYRMTRRGDVPAAKFGRSWRFHTDQLEKWIRDKAEHSLIPAHENLDPPKFRHLSTRETSAVLEFVSLLKKWLPQKLSRVVLYGSRARGDFRADSDIDLLIVLDSSGQDFSRLRKRISSSAREFSLGKGILLQILVISKKEWMQPSFRTFLLLEKIKREGIPLYD